eukprot:CAMPEP_0202881580 /NCGR_PEP_ID=MMETSP1391-20130828/36731_1 /ASSEMBLY_ACC=CAM_ASM_000867 /TAXON_ID=1034604 /ORGANISM="Chlamydomonas leiostraca, Strain SAG 11-49" /LENGTH=129 /DNA_ID=CAMNT_0049564287 /DNA_START=120 /DNA_END=506 /DNA_ORIENTATION=+
MELYRKRPADKPEKSVDDIVSRNVMERLRKDPPGGGAQAHNKGGAKVDDADLIASMAKRLSVLEKDLRERNSQLQRVQHENEHLKGKLKATEEELARRASASLGAPGPAPQADDSAQVAHLKSENTRLR